MIKSINIKNFESHENTTINFSENFNLIIGLSNSGKSSIIRALGVIVNNNWNKEMIRNGYNSCFIKVETDKGWVECERGEKINKWKCQEINGEIQNYKNVGNTVPDLVTKILGMGERERGNDLKELPNFQFQLERHYMLSEVGDKKATSNVIARMMDNAIGLGGMEDLIKAFSVDLLKDKKWLTEKQNEITELKSEILDKQIFNKYEQLINSVNDLFSKLESINKNLEIADTYFQKYNEIKEKFIKIENNVNNLSGINNIILLNNQVNLLRNKINLFEKSFELLKREKSLLKYQNISIEKMDVLINDCITNKKVRDYCLKALDYEKKISKLNNIKSVSLEKIYNKINELDKLKEKIINAENELLKARNLWLQKNNQEKNQQKINKDLDDNKIKFENLKKELGVCPLCGKKLSD